MKKADLERHLRRQGCYIDRDRGKHTVWINPANKRKAPVRPFGENCAPSGSGIIVIA